MVRERKIVAGSPDDDDDGKKNGGEANGMASGPNAIPTGENDSALRPKRISDMVGQTEVMDVIRIAMDAANSVTSRWDIFCSMVHLAWAKRL